MQSVRKKTRMNKVSILIRNHGIQNPVCIGFLLCKNIFIPHSIHLFGVLVFNKKTQTFRPLISYNLQNNLTKNLLLLIFYLSIIIIIIDRLVGLVVSMSDY